MSRNEIQNGIICPNCGTVILSPETREHFEVTEPDTKDDEPEIE